MSILNLHILANASIVLYALQLCMVLLRPESILLKGGHVSPTLGGKCPSAMTLKPNLCLQVTLVGLKSTEELLPLVAVYSWFSQQTTTTSSPVHPSPTPIGD